MRTLHLLAALVVAAAPAIDPARAGVMTYVIVPGETQTVGFESKAPLETFEGRTHVVTGHVALDPESVGDTVDLEVHVDMASLDTGLSMRNRHMRENHLHTDRFPFATFRGGAVTEGADARLADGEKHVVTVTGELDLHGVKREVAVPLELRLERTESEPDGQVRITATFPVALADHDIPRPRFLFAKLGEVQRVFVDLVAGRATPATAPTD